ncbi:hypothetical protein D0865_02054, partial [Hortaea werneckii]
LVNSKTSWHSRLSDFRPALKCIFWISALSKWTKADSDTRTEVPIHVHEEEFKYACWSVGTGADSGVYLGDYMNLTQLKWKTFTGDRCDLCQGITLHHAPGHTSGLCIMQGNLEKDGTLIWTTD